MRQVLRSFTGPIVVSLLFVSACSHPGPAAQERPLQSATQPAQSSTRWEPQIAAFEAMDRTAPPAKGGILFIGSSTIRLWKTLEQDFPKHRVINRGFGGSQIVDSTCFAERIVFPYEPSMIILRAGGNDIHARKSPQQVFADYRAFVAKVHKQLPRAQIVYISTNGTPSRWAEREDTQTLNRLIRDYARWKSYLKYIETWDMVLGPDGQPRPELFAPDKLHFNAEGYKLLAERVRPVLP